MNSVQILGNIVRDPELRYTKTGRSVTSFTVAVNRSWVSMQGERRESTDYIPVVAWGKLAELAGTKLVKGERVFVEGRFQTRSYETVEGDKRYMTEVVANFIAQGLDYDQAEMPPQEPKADFSQFGPQDGDGPDEEVPF